MTTETLTHKTYTAEVTTGKSGAFVGRVIGGLPRGDEVTFAYCGNADCPDCTKDPQQCFEEAVQDYLDLTQEKAA